ncbi:SixA phosphatase family protein [Litoreibacter arenae]|uniref:Phosphoglycerate mutase family protein n=1 Tax=Litoreibacter arenae DSM 19593 TaxID=1123360 RepID=S9RFG8_9RHOB|nr:histidine phosphatase family protein [Litoreibacter arenae]EPX76855.1 Phosphoglycerate mutase family protein [Litoreibacter arenae DSM 19593]
MKLILTRHAKSSWDDLTLDDHDRPLNERGQSAAQRMGKWIEGRRHVPAQVITSDAARARETAEIMVKAMGGAPSLTLDEGLYHASPDTVLARIQKAPKGDLMIVGHNPGIAALAALIVDVRPTHERFGVYPTTATLIAEVPVDDWSELQYGMARVIQFIVPRELKELNTA